jgi:hypothetical protein
MSDLSSLSSFLLAPSTNNRYIYIASDGTCDLKRYDFYRNTCSNIPLHDLSKPFSFTSILVLPQHDIFFTGDCSSPHSYILQHRSLRLITLPNLPVPRSGAALIYHEDSIYAFGGIHKQPLAQADRMSLKCNRWRELPKLRCARFNASCERIGNKIYIVGGTSSNIIEEFDMLRLRYRNLEVNWNIYWGIPVVKDDRLYILRGNSCVVCASKTMAYYVKKRKGWKGDMYSRSNKIYVNGSVVYHNCFSEKIEMYSFSQEDKVELFNIC